MFLLLILRSQFLTLKLSIKGYKRILFIFFKTIKIIKIISIIIVARRAIHFKKVKGSIYRNNKNGFYVYAKPNKCKPNSVIKYIGRYLGRPVIATSRIDDYNGDNVTFHYNRHEDEKLVTEIVPVLEFIERLIDHIPEKHFKMIRYYGLYARHRESDKKLHHAITKEKRNYYLSLKKWRKSILISFGYDPLKCSVCGTNMIFLELHHNRTRIPLDEMYKKVMANANGCRSPAYS